LSLQYSVCSGSKRKMSDKYKNIIKKSNPVTSPPNSTPRRFPSYQFSWPYSYIFFSSFTFPGARYWICLLFLPRLPCHFYLVVIEQQQHAGIFFRTQRNRFRILVKMNEISLCSQFSFWLIYNQTEFFVLLQKSKTELLWRQSLITFV